MNHPKQEPKTNPFFLFVFTDYDPADSFSYLEFLVANFTFIISCQESCGFCDYSDWNSHCSFTFHVHAATPVIVHSLTL